MTFRIVMSPGACGVRSGAVAILVNMKRMLLSWSKALQISYHFNRLTLLGKSNHAMALLPRGRMYHGDCLLNGRALGGEHSKV